MIYRSLKNLIFILAFLCSLYIVIRFFNQQFHASEEQPQLKDFHELMRASKNRCQLMLLKFASPELVWVRPDPTSLGGEWLVGSADGKVAHHIPFSTLQHSLSDELLTAWQIG